MEKPTWRKIETNSKKPSPRWGHTCCVVGEQIVFFGGYADSNYMNDVWSYNTNTKKWEEIITTGDKPSPRSNCSMNYNPQNQQIVIFGGGGPNKQRFNTIYLLEWKTKVWVEIPPKENEPAPWERTYHVAEVKFPYLVVFGGEGVTDLDDLWVFNFLTLRWTEVKSNQNGVKPCPRRFHSSCMINNEFFVIAGCRGKYRCLSDIYSLDLTSLIDSGSIKDLNWVERKFKGSSFLSRWGHSSVVYDQKIYIFAGRFSNDLNDLLMIDIQNNTLKTIKVGGNSNDHPKPRRRHCSGFVGSCMIGFGGFNGEYFNDLFYINIFELFSKVTGNINFGQTNISYVNNIEYSDNAIYAKNGQPFYISSGLIARYFKSEGDFTNYIGEIDYKYTQEELLNIFTSLYRGYGKFEEQEQNMHQKYGIFLNQTINRRIFIDNIINIQQKQTNCLKLSVESPEKSSNIVFQMQNQQFSLFLQNRNNWWFNDGSIDIITPAYKRSKIQVNKFLLTINSLYFKNLFSNKYCKNESIKLSFEKDYGCALDLLFNFMMMGVVVVPQTFNYQLWMDLAELSDYFCVHQLKALCESQLCMKVCSDKVQMLSKYSQKMQLSNLSMHCAHFQIKNSITTNNISKKGSLINKKDRSHSFIKLYDTIKFDLLHCNLVEAKSTTSKGKNQHPDKQNEMEYANV